MAEVQVEPSTTIEVRVVNEAGEAVAGVAVKWLAMWKGLLEAYVAPEAMAQRLSQTTGKDGVARFSGLPRSGREMVGVADARFATQLSLESLPQFMEGGSRAYSMTLLPAATVRGQVRIGESGQPVAGVRVVVRDFGQGAIHGQARTDAEGRYVIGRLRPGTCYVVAELEGELAKEWAARPPENVEVAKGQQIEGVDIELTRGVVITTRVTAKDNGEPIAGVPIDIYGPARPGWDAQQEVTGPDGRVTMRVPPGKQSIHISRRPPGFDRPRGPDQPSYQVEVREGETYHADFRLPRNPAENRVTVRVLDAEGKEAAGAEAFVSDQTSDGFLWEPVRQDGDGKFQFLVNDFYHRPSFRARRGGDTSAEAVRMTGAGEVTLKLVPKSFGVVRGRVVDEAGMPIVGAAISLGEWVLGAEKIQLGSPSADAEPDWSRGMQMEVMLTGRDGRFEIVNLWPGEMTSVSAAATKYTKETVRRFVLKPGEVRELPAIVLKAAPFSIAGRVVDENGAPVAGVCAYISPKISSEQRVVTDREGRFRFADMADEKVVINVGRSLMSGAAEARAGDKDVEIVLKPLPMKFETASKVEGGKKP